MTSIVETEFYTGPERRAKCRRDDDTGGRIVHLEGLVEKAIKEALEGVKLVDAETHEKHHEYIEAVLIREAKRAAFRDAVIEKTLSGLLIAAIAAIGARVWFVFTKPWSQ